MKTEISKDHSPQTLALLLLVDLCVCDTADGRGAPAGIILEEYPVRALLLEYDACPVLLEIPVPDGFVLCPYSFFSCSAFNCRAFSYLR